jgi:hypothetical protein
MLDYKSMSNEELRQMLANAGTELLSRRAETVPAASEQHSYRIAMPRTSKAEPEAFRFTPVGRDVIGIPLLLDQVIGKTSITAVSMSRENFTVRLGVDIKGAAGVHRRPLTSCSAVRMERGQRPDLGFADLGIAGG